MIDNPVLECQDCGSVVRKLTQTEDQAVAANPYNFIVFCRECAAHQNGENQ
jgi:hypothetical protein